MKITVLIALLAMAFHATADEHCDKDKKAKPEYYKNGMPVDGFKKIDIEGAAVTGAIDEEEKPVETPENEPKK